MSEDDAPKELASTQTLAVTLFVVVIGALVFAAFSFITFGLPLMVLAVGGVIWMYVGLMKWVDRALAKRSGRADGGGKSR